MQIDLPPALEAFVREQVETGAFRDETDVVSYALRKARDDAAAASERRQALFDALDEGLADIAAGRVHTVNSLEELQALIRSR